MSSPKLNSTKATIVYTSIENRESNNKTIQYKQQQETKTEN